MPSIQFGHIAIGGTNAWRSENKDKIMKAKELDITTSLRFSLPFSLLRLLNGSYDLKESQCTYKFVISNISRNPAVAKDITG